MKQPHGLLVDLSILVLGVIGTPLRAHAAEDAPAPEAAIEPSTPSAPLSRWTWDFESAYVFQNIQNPWFLLAGYRGFNNGKNPFDYHLNSYLFGARYDLTDIKGTGPLRGYVQSSMDVIYADILQGPEHYYAGVVGSIRYLFVPGDGTWSPYVELRGGVGATDASHIYDGQQDDLAFTYLIGLGLRYQPNPRWRFSVGIVDQHMSDFYLTKQNFGFDSAGLIVAVERRQ
jgi:hypothetical protein